MDTQHQISQRAVLEEETEKLLSNGDEDIEENSIGTALQQNDTELPQQRKHHQEHQRQERSILSLGWWLSNLILLVLVIYLAFFQKHRPQFEHEFAGDVNEIPPRFEQEIVTFNKDVRFVGNLSSPTFKDDTREHWLGLVPKGLGFISVNNPTLYPQLPEPYIKYNLSVYTTSVTHQLHCLYMLMHGFNDIINLGYLTMPDEGEDPFDHLSHCFDYLRQAIMCHGDMALEGLQHSFGPDVGGSDGWGVKHVCKRYEDVYDWLEKRRIDDRIWI